jgi:hypothetical protein
MSRYSRTGAPMRPRPKALNRRAMKAWRAAAELVWTRWELAREASGDRRAGAFATYLAALDAEAGAPTTLATRRRWPAGG